ncbi:hypothetical protein NSQ29_01180 [Paenibacillus sp. FSL F4-0236]|uniref:hypothetical protein n=1 Tax=Paenibacillus sp. FSL F4-0236 TaxID=2954731 RepID=UPI0030F6864C
MNKRTNILLQLVFIAAITLTIWNGAEGAKFNQRYERSIQRHEQSTKEYTEYLKNMKNQLQELKLAHSLNPKSSEVRAN